MLRPEEILLSCHIFACGIAAQVASCFNPPP
jgi:hypothetical protein